MVSPPRDRPSASRSLPGLAGLVPAGGGFLSFDGAPRAGRGAQPRHRQPLRVDVRPAAHAAPRRRAGARGPPSHPPRPSTPCPPPHHTRRAAGPGSSPRSRPLTSGDAGYTRSSSSRTAPADPATGTPPGPVEDPVDHQPVIIPPVPLPRMTRQQRLQPHPLRIGQIMPFQPVIIHGAIQPKRPMKIYGTRPSRGPWPGASRRRVPRPDLPVGGHVFMEWSAVRWLPGKSPPPRGGQPRRLGTGRGLISAETGAVWLGAAECVAAAPVPHQYTGGLRLWAGFLLSTGTYMPVR